MTFEQYMELLSIGLCDGGITDETLRQAEVDVDELSARWRELETDLEIAEKRKREINLRFNALNIAAKENGEEYWRARKEALEGIVSGTADVGKLRKRADELRAEGEWLTAAITHCSHFTADDAHREVLQVEARIADMKADYNEAVGVAKSIKSWLLMKPALEHDPGISISSDTQANQLLQAAAKLRLDAQESRKTLRDHDDRVARERAQVRLL